MSKLLLQKKKIVCVLFVCLVGWLVGWLVSWSDFSLLMIIETKFILFIHAFSEVQYQFHFLSRIEYMSGIYNTDFKSQLHHPFHVIMNQSIAAQLTLSLNRSNTCRPTNYVAFEGYCLETGIADGRSVHICVPLICTVKSFSNILYHVFISQDCFFFV